MSKREDANKCKLAVFGYYYKHHVNMYTRIKGII